MRKPRELVIGAERIAYFAGLFDGEGCVNARVHGRVTELRVQVTNTDIRPLLMLRSFYGGSISKTKVEIGRRQCWAWYLGGQASVQFVSDIFTYSIIKRDQLEAYMLIAETLKSGRVVTDEMMEYRQSLMTQIKQGKNREYKELANVR